jgi:hypothetical protein
LVLALSGFEVAAVAIYKVRRSGPPNMQAKAVLEVLIRWVSSPPSLTLMTSFLLALANQTAPSASRQDELHNVIVQDIIKIPNLPVVFLIDRPVKISIIKNERSFYTHILINLEL